MSRSSVRRVAAAALQPRSAANVGRMLTVWRGASGFASASAVTLAGAAEAAASGNSRKLASTFSKELVDSIYRSSFKNQTGVSLKYMMDFGAQPIQRQLMMSSQFLLKVWVTLCISSSDLFVPPAV